MVSLSKAAQQQALRTVAASEDDPRYLVESEKSGKEAAHKPDALIKVQEEQWRKTTTGSRSSSSSTKP